MPCRLAPLSQGRIEPSDGTLQCSYHGWRFAGSGAAAAIPQAAHDSAAAERTATASKRSCVATYPTQVPFLATAAAKPLHRLPASYLGSVSRVYFSHA